MVGGHKAHSLARPHLKATKAVGSGQFQDQVTVIKPPLISNLDMGAQKQAPTRGAGAGVEASTCWFGSQGRRRGTGGTGGGSLGGVF